MYDLYTYYVDVAGGRIQGRPEGSVFNGYYNKV